MRIFISGPITGMPNENRGAFFDEAGRINRAGHTPVNPFCLPQPNDRTWHGYMRMCIQELLFCDAVQMLPRWAQSNGAVLEYRIAIGLGIPVTMPPTTVFESYNVEDDLK